MAWSSAGKRQLMQVIAGMPPAGAYWWPKRCVAGGAETAVTVTTSPQSFVLPLPFGHVAALRHGREGAIPVLALHGWLDNAASFEALAGQLGQAVDLVAIDLPGHGHSDWLAEGAQAYNLTAAIDQVLAIADALGWQRFVLLGHSMGAAIASLVAAVAPQRVDRVISLDALGGLSAPAADTVQRLRAHQRAVQRPASPLRLFTTLDTPVRARMLANQLGEVAARQLVERGLRAVDGGWQWRSDPRLTLPTAVYMTEEQVHAVLAAITCPVLVVLATPAPSRFPQAQRQQRAACLRDGHVLELAGNHHLHMEQAGILAPAVLSFIAPPGGAS
jgi:pimeloyl-ACP methyl ester carboxylesterase